MILTHTSSQRHSPIQMAYPLLDIQICVSELFGFSEYVDGLQVQQRRPIPEKGFGFRDKRNKTSRRGDRPFKWSAPSHPYHIALSLSALAGTG